MRWATPFTPTGATRDWEKRIVLPNCRKMVLVTLFYTCISPIRLSCPIWTFWEVSLGPLVFSEQFGQTKFDDLATCLEIGKNWSTEDLSSMRFKKFNNLLSIMLYKSGILKFKAQWEQITPNLPEGSKAQAKFSASNKWALNFTSFIS